MMVWLLRFARDEGAATSIEYALIASIMMAAIIAGSRVFTDEVAHLYEIITNSVNSAAS